MAKDYFVTMPFAGAVTIAVEANSEEEAQEKFYDEFNKLEGGINDPQAETEWDFYEHMHSGNVAHYSHWDVEVEEA